MRLSYFLSIKQIKWTKFNFKWNLSELQNVNNVFWTKICINWNDKRQNIENQTHYAPLCSVPSTSSLTRLKFIISVPISAGHLFRRMALLGKTCLSIFRPGVSQEKRVRARVRVRVGLGLGLGLGFFFGGNPRSKNRKTRFGKECPAGPLYYY